MPHPNSPNAEDFDTALEQGMAALLSSEPGESPTETQLNTPSNSNLTASLITNSSPVSKPAVETDEKEKQFNRLGHLDNDEDVAKLRTWMMNAPKMAGRFTPGTMEFYDWMAPAYALMPDMAAKGAWLRGLVREHAEWIGLKEIPKAGTGAGGEGFRVLDYGAGTGFLSVALAPYATEIVALDYSEGMVDAYNDIAEKMTKKGEFPHCTMRALRGDFVTDPPYVQRCMNPQCKDHHRNGVDADGLDPDGLDPQSFDMVAICLTIDFFTPPDGGRKEFREILARLISFLKPGGILLIIDIERYTGTDPHPPMSRLGPTLTMEGTKTSGNGSPDVRVVLERMQGLEGVDVKEDLRFRFGDVQGGGRGSGGMVRDEVFFVVKARMG